MVRRHKDNNFKAKDLGQPKGTIYARKEEFLKIR